MLNSVLFDLDNTLIDRNQAFRECVNAQFRGQAVRAQLDRLDRGGRGDRQMLFDCWERHAHAPMNQAIFGRLLAEQLRSDQCLIEALHRLSRSVKLGIITNGSGETQRQKIRAAGLEPVFPTQRVWVSAEVGKAKPDPAIFLLAAQSLGEAPGHCLYIGNDAQDDVAGASAAGMRARRVDAVLNAERLGELLSQEGVQ